MKTKKSLQKKIKRVRTSKKYNIIKQNGGGFQIGDDVINYETKERGVVIGFQESSVGDLVIIKGWNVRNPKVHNSHLKLYTEYESQERQRKLFEAYLNKDKDPETYKRLKQEEVNAALKQPQPQPEQQKPQPEQQKPQRHKSVSFQRFRPGQRFKHYSTGKQGKVLMFRDDPDEKRVRQIDPIHYNYIVQYDNGESDNYLHQDDMI
jgi:hypothetical protein